MERLKRNTWKHLFKKLYFENGKDAATSFRPPIGILINASKVLESIKTKKGYHF
jgi:hypothetical protein